MESPTKAFLEQLQLLKDEKSKVNVLSTGKKIDSSPLSFKQQKDLISTIADGSVGVLKFQKFINDVIIENTGDNTIKVTDKLPIIIQLRMESIGDKIKIGDLEGTLTLDNILKYKPTYTKSVEGTGMTIDLEVPTIAAENKVINATIETLKKDGDQELGKNVTNIYTYEIVKYIKTISFGENTLVFADLPMKDRVKIVDNLPLATNKEIIAFIQENKKQESDLLTVTIKGEEVSFDIDVSFFDS